MVIGRIFKAVLDNANRQTRVLLSVIGLSALLSNGSNAQTIYSDTADLSLKFDRTTNENAGSNGPGEAANPVGKSGAGAGFDRAAVFVFQLPDLGVTDDPFGTATLGLYLFQDTVNGDVNGNLYGLGRRDFPDVQPEDYYGRDAVPDPTDATLLQADYLTADGLILNSLVTTSIEGSLALTEYLNSQYEGGLGIGQYVFLRVNTDADTNQRWNLVSADGASGDLSQTPQINYILASEPVDTIQVESQSDGSGMTIPDQTLTAGEMLSAFAIARDGGGEFLDNVAVSWTLSNPTGEVVPGDLVVAEDGKSATFIAAGPGTAEVSIFGNAANLIGTGTITVVAGPAAQVVVETAFDGSGEPIGDQILGQGRTLTAFAVSRDAGGNFIGSVPAVWSLEEISDGVVAGDLVASVDETSATLTGNEVGTARIRATVDGLNSVDSGVITVAEVISLWDGGGPVTNLGVAENWFADIAPAFDNTTDLIFNDPSITRLNPYFGEDRMIRSLTYNADADRNLNLGLTVNGTSGAANLTFDTDSGVDPAQIVVDAEATGNFRLGRVTAPDVNEYGSILLADDLLITHNGSGTLTLDGDITEVGEPKNVIKAGTGTLIMAGSNAYTGDTSVSGGVLSVNGTSLSDDGELVISDAVVEVEGNEIVGNLTIDGSRKSAGVYGSSLSTAPVENQDDTRFAGTGTVTVTGVSTGPLRILSITFDGTDVTLTWNSNPGESFSIFFSGDLRDFLGDVDDGVEAAEVGNITEFTFPIAQLPGDDPPKAYFRVNRN